MNTVVLSSAISAGNHALFAGTRVLYGLAQASRAVSLFAWTMRDAADEQLQRVVNQWVKSLKQWVAATTILPAPSP
jgi:L-asparagine transporter-like permease